MPTYRYGTERIDFILASWSLLPQISNIKIEYCSQLRSDHPYILFTLQWPKKINSKSFTRYIQQCQFQIGLLFRKRVWERGKKLNIFEFGNNLRSLQAHHKTIIAKTLFL